MTAPPATIPYPAEEPGEPEPQTPAQFHTLAALAAKNAKDILNGVRERLDAGSIGPSNERVTAEATRASAYAQLSMAYSTLAWAPVFDAEFPTGDLD